jgi:hypothetical protein
MAPELYDYELDGKNALAVLTSAQIIISLCRKAVINTMFDNAFFYVGKSISRAKCFRVES